LNADFARLGEQIREAEAAGAKLIHIDVMDGRFVPNISLGPEIVQSVRPVTELPFDVHLMIVEPDRHLEAFAQAGADAISVHVEACPHLHRTLQHIREVGCRVGVAINPHTPASALHSVMDLLDEVIVMTVNPGFGGQTLIESTLPKIAEIRAMIGESGRHIDLEVDGGINPATAMQAAQAGANVLIAGTGLFSDEHSVADGVEALMDALQK
jgi:ribulose-phosphate 3-epimerase